MCHMSPTAQMLGLLITIITTVFTIWHIWCFDRGRCLLFTRRDVFRWIILMMLIVALCCFTIWSGTLTYVKYDEYYGLITHPDGTKTVGPVPWQRWSTHRQDLIRAGYHIVSVGWGLLVSVHAEETLYWAYLIGSIRNRDSKTWFQSKYFKIWVLSVVSAMCIIPGVACIETTNLNEMEHYLFFAGSILALINFVGSLWLVIIFPGFIKESRKQGANPDVLGRLQYFKELNSARTVLRLFYALCLLTLSVDAWTKHKAVNMSPFWTDVTFTSAYFSALTSTALAVMILLPRSMADEAGAAKQAQVFIQQPQYSPYSNYLDYPSDARRKSSLNSATSSSYPPSLSRDTELQNLSHSPFDGQVERTVSRRSLMPHQSAWGALGERLNVDSSHLDGMASNEGDRYRSRDGMEMGRTQSQGSVGSLHAPFAAQPGSRVLAEGETVPHVPIALNEFRGPLAVNQPRRPVDLNIVVVSETIVEKD